MQKNQWMTAEDLTNLVAIAEMTRGPLSINCATFAGTQTAGVAGGIVSVLGVLMPAFTLTLVIVVFFTRFQKIRVMADCFTKEIVEAKQKSIIDGYLSKPVSDTSILEAIRNCQD